MTRVIEIRRYVDRAGKDVIGDWLRKLADNQARARVLVRIDRIASGNFGDAKRLRAGIWELRVDWGPGYRIYYAMISASRVLLLCAGDKRTQSADIERAIGYLRDYRERTKQ